MNYEFANPWLLSLLLLIPLLILWQLAFRTRQEKTLNVPSIAAFGSSPGWFRWYAPLLFALRMIILSLLIVALARPRKVDVSTKVKSNKGIDIMMVVDVSLSMQARDLKPNRISALKEVAENFVIKRPADRIGLVAYSGEGVTKVPLTTDHGILIDAIYNLNMEELESGTAIGVGMATAINQLKHSKAESKIIILITDGGESNVNYSENKTYISPMDAAEIALDMGIKVYSIGIGTTGFIPLPPGYQHYPQTAFQLDEKLLKNIAAVAKGNYYRSTDNKKLEEIFDEINQLEKSEIDEIKYYNYTEFYRYFVGIALFLMLIDVLLNTTIFKRLT